MTLYDLPAPAKLNLFLHIVGRRADGYHLLESVFRLISLADSLTIDLRRDGAISRDSTLGEQIADSDDLVVRAAQALQKSTGCSLGAHISVTKRVPVGAGLGGGSSDAATVLIALNRLWRTGLDRRALEQIALTLGADVPFFVGGQNAFVRGIGEIMDPVELADCSYLVFKPAVHVPTAAVFKSPDLTRNSESVKMSDFSERAFFIAPGSRQYTENVVVGFGKNDLEPVVGQMYPQVDAAMRWVAGQGLGVRLSGSGSCFFAEFVSPDAAELALVSLLGKIRSDCSEVDGGIYSVIEQFSVCDSLPEHPLHHWTKD